MLSHFKISTRLKVCFSIVTLIIIILGTDGYWGVMKVTSSADDIAKALSVLLELSQSNRAEITIMRRFEKDVFINIADTGKVDEYRKKWDASLAKFHSQNETMTKLVDSPRNQEMLAAIRKYTDEYAAGFRKVFDQVKAGEITTTQDANKAIGQFKIPTHQAETLVADFSGEMRKSIDEKISTTRGLASKISISLAIFVALATSVAILMSVVVERSITLPLLSLVSLANTIAEGNLSPKIEETSKDEIGQLKTAMHIMLDNLRHIIIQVNSSSMHLASASTQLYSTAKRITTGTDEVIAQSASVATAGEEMAATSHDIAHNCQLAAEGARRATQAASGGVEVVERTVAVMERIASKVLESAKTVESLGTRSEQIGAIIGTIHDIADKTNLLALNAAIEAARAGEQGRGFAVVASEVRDLAERTTRSTKEIDNMIKAIQKETGCAVIAMEQGVNQVEVGTIEATNSGAALQDILAQVSNMSMQVNQIATAAEEQTATTSEISNNMNLVTEIVQNTSQSVKESETLAEQLRRDADELHQLVQQFKL